MKRFFFPLATIAAGVAVAVSGCGASSVTDDAVAKAATATTSKHGSDIQMTITMSSAALPQTIRMTANGVMDPVARKARINLDMSQLASAGLGSSIKPSQLQATEILDGTVFYMRMPLFDGKLPGDKKWMKIDIAKTGKALGLNLGSLSQPGQDPSQQLAYLRTVSGAKKVGTETIRGVQTTHYHGVAKLDDYPELLPENERAGARAAIQRLEKLIGSNSYPVDAWVGKDGLLRRMKFTMNMDVGQTGQSITMGIQEDLSNFGTPVDVTPPASRDVYDATKVTSNAIQSSGLGG
ncbi:MAG TPA: hypothetical protein VH817_05455 [Thermoleophilaceae bacterium]|jgi:hypothetical protein